MHSGWYVPYHLLKDLINIPYWPSKECAVPNKAEYEVSGTIEDFYDFYSKFPQYDVEKASDALIVDTENFKVMLTFSQDEDVLKVAFSLQS